jgi:hypothetical protein
MTSLGRPRTTLALKCLKACNCSARTWRSYTIPTTMRSRTVCKPLNPNRIEEHRDLKEGFALHCFGLLASH